MTDNEIRSMAEAGEFDKVACIPVEKLVIRQEYRLCCEENTCGNYNANYGCPPDCGTPQEMEDRVRAYKRALVMQTRAEMDDIEDTELTKAVRTEHNRKAGEVIGSIRKAGVEGLAMMPGPCSVCKVCGKKKGTPCPFPEKRTSCLSAYGLDVTSLAEACGMRLDWDGASISYFALYLYDKA